MGVGIALASCASIEARRLPSLVQSIDDAGARVMWVGAHPDDETLAGPVLARACIALRRPCALFVLTRGEGGRCPFKTGCYPSLGSVRSAELARVARAYRAELEQHHFWNAPLPESSFPRRAELARRWLRQGDPAALIANAIRRFQPTILLTFDPDRGFTGHPEHQLAARFALQGARRAAEQAGPNGEPAHRVAHVYQVLNRYWITRILGTADPATPTERFDTHLPCGAPNRPCLDVALEITKLHRTQARDMGLVRILRPQMGALYLKAVDPLAGALPEPLAER